MRTAIIPSQSNRIALLFGFLLSLWLTGFSQQFKKEQGTTVGISFASAGFNQKVQQLYTSADLGSPTTGLLSKIYFKKMVGSTTMVTLTNFQVKVGLTINQTLPSTSTFVTNLTTVLRKESCTLSAPTPNVFFGIDIDTTFQYQTGMSLIVEYSWSTASAGSFNVLTSTGPSGGTTKVLRAASPEATNGIASTMWTDFGFDLTTTATAPLNDGCTGAITIKPASVLSTYTSNNVGATQSIAPITCNGSISTTANDVWFTTFFATSTDSIVVQGLGGFDPVVELLSGTCGTTSIACSDDPVNSSATEVISPGNLTTGTLYSIRVYGWNGAQGSFTIGVKSHGSSTAATDACNILSGLQSTTNNNFSGTGNRFATQSYPPVSCNSQVSTGPAYDIWFTFTCFGANDSIIILPELDFTPVIDLYSQSCNTASYITCARNSFIPGGKVVLAPGNLTPGTIYYFRVYGWNGTQGDFKICVKRTPPSSLANDECVNAISLTPTSACTPVEGTTTGANQSMLAGCLIATNLPENDVWYSFVPQSASDTVFVTPTSAFNPIVELFSGCGQSFHIRCSNSASANTVEKIGGNLAVGQTYYVRIHGWTTINGTFNICVKTPPVAPPPVNNECNTAIGLTVNEACTPVTGTNTEATQSLAPVNCGGSTSSTAKDVWYSFVASDAGDSVIVDPLVTFDAVVELFSGSCSSLSSIGCSDHPILGGATEKIATGNLIAGQTYYIRVYGWSTKIGDFDICVKKEACQIPSISNAGADQTSCVGFAFMNASVPTSGNGNWSLISGSGTIENPGQPTSKILNLGSGANVFRWTVATACTTSSDDVTINNGMVIANGGPDQIYDQSSGNKNLGSGSPSGGVWTGSGVTGMVFSTIQSSGTYPVLYCFTNGQGCSACDTIQVTIRPPVGKCDIPIISPGTGTYISNQTITLSTKTPGATIYYTLSGNNPIVGSGFTRVYSGPITITNTVALKAMAVKTGLANSGIISAYYSFPVTANPVISPGTGIQPGNTQVSISCATSGATIYYTTNGNLPRFDVPNSFTKIYTGPFTITGTSTIWAVAKHPNFQYSYNVSVQISIPPVRLNPGTGTYPAGQLVSMTNTTPGASIYFTTDGTVPVVGQANTKLYSTPVAVNLTSTIRAISYKNNSQDGLTAVGYYTIPAVANPVFSPGPGPCLSPCLLLVSTITEGAQIWYTTTGNTPDTTKAYTKRYNGPFLLTLPATIKAQAYKNGLTPSGVVTGNFTQGAAREAVAMEFETHLTKQFQLSPNPAQIFTTLQGLEEGETAQIQVWNSAGQLINIPTERSEPTGIKLIINHLPAGLYLVSVKKASKFYTLRLVKE